MLDGETGVDLFYILDNWKSAIILIVKSIFFHEITPIMIFFVNLIGELTEFVL